MVYHVATIMTEFVTSEGLYANGIHPYNCYAYEHCELLMALAVGSRIDV